MRILMLSPHPTVRSPLVKHTPILVEALRELGCEVVSEPWGRRTDSEMTARKLISRFVDVARVRWILSQGEFDALVVKTAHDRVSLMRDVALVLAVRRRARRIVIQLHGGHSEWLVRRGKPFFKAGSRLLFALSDGVLVLSRTQKQELERFAPSATFRVVANPFVPPRAEEGRHNSKDDVPIVLFASRLLVKKGIFDLVEAAARLKERLAFRLVIVGSGPEADALASRIDALDLREHVTLRGFIPSDQLPPLYHSADVFVLPTYDSEGLPTVFVEAMAAGLPIVATRNRGIIDHVRDGVNALLVSDRSPNELADALECILSDEALRARMSTANIEKVRDFAPEPVAKHYLDTLNDVCERASSRRTD